MMHRVTVLFGRLFCANRLIPAVAVLLCSALAGGSVHAQTPDITSIYTSTAPKDCRTLKPRSKTVPEDGPERWCKGIGDLSVLVLGGDLRETVSFGRTAKAAAAESAAKNWFGPFTSTTMTVEWRGPRNGAPFAAIQRWHLADNDDVGKDNRPLARQLLVVTRLPPGKVCHIAYIDVKANPDANALARMAAESARAFDCDKDKVRVEGLPGRATALALP
jgi:hypothetical protein